MLTQTSLIVESVPPEPILKHGTLVVQAAKDLKCHATHDLGAACLLPLVAKTSSSTRERSTSLLGTWTAAHDEALNASSLVVNHGISNCIGHSRSKHYLAGFVTDVLVKTSLDSIKRNIAIIVFVQVTNKVNDVSLSEPIGAVSHLWYTLNSAEEIFAVDSKQRLVVLALEQRPKVL